MKVELKGIEIVMGDKVAKLSITEAQELRKQLNDLFGEKIVHVPSAPIIIERDCWPYWIYPNTTPVNPYPSFTYQSSKTSPDSIQVMCVGGG